MVCGITPRRRDHQHHDVGDLGAAGAHRGERAWPGVSMKVILAPDGEVT